MADQPVYVPSPRDWVREQVDVYEGSAGESGNTLQVQGMDLPVIIVTSIGRKTGHVRETPLMRVEHNGQYALVGSYGGRPHDPGWCWNLRANPEKVTIQDGPKPFAVTVRELDGDERAVWWKRAVEAFTPYSEYEGKAGRVIPIFLAARRSS
jgi:F420H(2)-dependent quinone reductase